MQTSAECTDTNAHGLASHQSVTRNWQYLQRKGSLYGTVHHVCPDRNGEFYEPARKKRRMTCDDDVNNRTRFLSCDTTCSMIVVANDTWKCLCMCVCVCARGRASRALAAMQAYVSMRARTMRACVCLYQPAQCLTRRSRKRENRVAASETRSIGSAP